MRLALVCALILCSSTVFAAKNNVVLVVTDDQGRDAGCYGNPVVQTPHLDRLAAGGVRFTHAFCTTASCSASRSVILSGLFNHRNAQYGHVHTYHHFRSYGDLRTLPTRIRELGYRTGRIGKFHVGPEEVYPFEKALSEGKSATPVPRNARNPVAMAEACRDFLADPDERPFFLYFCTSDPHRGGGRAEELPHQPERFGNRPAGEGYKGIKPVRYALEDVIVPAYLPDTPTCRAELAQYYQSISRVDQGLGRLVEVLKETDRWKDTLFIYMSDHGAAFPGAKTTVYEPGLRSPCVVRHPYRATPGLVNPAMISWVDIAPTILDFCGANAESLTDLHGRSFLSILGETSPSGWDQIYASHTFHEITMYYPMRVVRNRRFKLIWNIAHGLPYPFASDLWAAPTWQTTYEKGPAALFGKRTVAAYIDRPRFELYDLEQDPHEVHNLAENPEHKGVLERLQADLKAFQERTKDPWVRKWRYE